MTAKQYLKQAYRLNELINSDLEEVAQLRDFSTSISSPSFDSEPVSGSRPQEAKFEKAVLKIIDLESKINAEIDSYVNLKAEIRETINQLDDADEKLLLRYRYINFFTWEDIAEKMNVSIRTIHRIHASALQNVKLPTRLNLDT